MIKRDMIECVQVWIKKPIINELEKKLLNMRDTDGYIRKGAFIDKILAEHLKIENPKK